MCTYHKKRKLCMPPTVIVAGGWGREEEGVEPGGRCYMVVELVGGLVGLH